ncbi:hypothetical protein BCR33DRAFT_857923 [Rhizoclosmatium globosum]|uniref:PX domain-containing protein n=1 Tax=Rhizoclosmatium globosum TaxID=329046 RepID=A0A1Y2B3T5_9FUNG|nr:hypothetical protein BCR33DRAFT_857923 [Rhizoclosmatium globosum]|eukprot:ORY28745.1 hypothetical protein BCR33DRAFT_857923 [Rhizoclosmatium globosum]
MSEEETEVFEEAGSEWDSGIEETPEAAAGALAAVVTDEELDSEVVQRLVLRYVLGAQLMTSEFVSFFGLEASSVLTTQPLKGMSLVYWTAPSTPTPPNPHNINHLNQEQEQGLKTLPPLSNSGYRRWIRRLPWLAGNGSAYLAALDGHVDAAFRTAVAAWLRATQFDVLGFAKHHYALFLLAYSPSLSFNSKALQRLAATVTPTGRFTTYPTSTQHVHKSHLHIHTLPNPIQQLRYESLSLSFTQFLRLGADIILLIDPSKRSTPPHPSDPYPYATNLFDLCKDAQQLHQVHPLLQDWVHALAKALAIGFENILDDEGWRGKARRVWAKMPLTLVVTSLRLINPVPFVETLLRIFIWKPPGGLHSLLQSLAGVICSMSKTRAEVKALRAKVSPQNRTDIEKTMNHLWESTKTSISSTPQDEQRVLDALRDAGVFVNETYRDSNDEEYNLNTRYARLLLRQKEKTLFIDCLGSDEFTSLIVHVIKFLPPILKELWDCIHMADLLQSLFDSLTEMLEIMGRYDKEEEVDLSSNLENDVASISTKPGPPTTIPDRPPTSFTFSSIASSVYRASTSSLTPTTPTTPTAATDKDSIHSTYSTTSSLPKKEVSQSLYESTITKLEAQLYKFAEHFYPAFHKLSHRAPNGPIGMHAMADWFAREFGEGMREFVREEKAGEATPIVTTLSTVYGSGTKKRCVLDISALDAAEPVANSTRFTDLWVDVEAVTVGLVVVGIDENGWVRRGTSGDFFPMEESVLGGEALDMFRRELMDMVGEVDEDEEKRMEEEYQERKKKLSSSSSFFGGVLGSAGGSRNDVRNGPLRQPSTASLRSFDSSSSKKKGWF